MSIIIRIQRRSLRRRPRRRLGRAHWPAPPRRRGPQALPGGQFPPYSLAYLISCERVRRPVRQALSGDPLWPRRLVPWPLPGPAGLPSEDRVERQSCPSALDTRLGSSQKPRPRWAGSSPLSRRSGNAPAVTSFGLRRSRGAGCWKSAAGTGNSWTACGPGAGMSSASSPTPSRMGRPGNASGWMFFGILSRRLILKRLPSTRSR